MVKYIKKLKAPIPTLCYSLAVVIYLVVSFFNFAVFSVMRFTGNVKTYNVSIGDLQLVDIEVISDTKVKSTSVDPQVIFGANYGIIEGLEIVVRYQLPADENCLYYETSAEKPFGQQKRVWQNEKKNDVLQFKLPFGTKILRWDPTNANQNVMDITRITINPPKTFFSYFQLDGGGIFCLAVIPGLAAAFISFFIECKKHYFKDTKVKKEEK